MAKEDIKEKEAEKVEISESKDLELKPYKVKKEIVYDKVTPYKKGSTIYLPEGKIKEKLISNNFI